ncbi:hypothetical protein PDESU_04239 [Pontiella desulfatans]|uniref:Sialate O-acetylesterase domain-containing protein n=2 Tax=Pontiella desulfatans TaxID=2750659 RepID=A0A6C2U8A9_PONDE|nr:hypothetical protein PDESU_04239 [Pontiella desulfatans]
MLLGFIAGNSSAESEVIAGWHDFNPSGANGLYKTSAAQKAPDTSLNGVDGGLYCAAGNRYNWGSTDGTFGTSADTGSTSTDGVMAMRTNPGEESLFFTVANHTGADLALGSIAFDFDGISANAPTNLSLRYFGGDLGATEVEINSISGINALRNGTVSDYYDVDWSLAALADTTLANGESATFRLFVSDAVNTLQAMAIDNLAVLGGGTGAPVTTLKPRKSISINFTNGEADKTIASGEIAGFERSNAWNEAPSSSGGQTSVNLLDDAGEETTASVTTTFGHLNSGTGGTGSANDRLYRAYGLVSGSEGVAVSNLPPAFTEAGYSVIVYFDIDAGVADRTHFFTLGNQTFWGTEESGFFSGTFRRAKGNTAGAASSTANYAVFTGLTNSNFTIAGGTADGARAAICGIQVVADAGVDVYLLSGQSNMGGYGEVAAARAAGQQIEFPEILTYHSANVAANSPAKTLGTLAQMPVYNAVNHGPEIGLGDRLLELNPNGTQMAFIKHAQDGRNLYDHFAPGTNSADVANWGEHFSLLVDTVTNGLAELRAHGFEPAIQGMVWQQGEADAKSETYTNIFGEQVNSSTQYDTNMRNFISRIREQFAADAGDDGIRFVLGEVFPQIRADLADVFPGYETVKATQLGLDETQTNGFPNTATVPADTDGMSTNEQMVDGYRDWDDIHLSWQGQVTLGRSMADLLTGRRVAIASPSSRHIVQRDAGNRGTIEVSGTYTIPPDVVEARTVVMAGANSGTGSAWSTIAVAPSNGVFNGALTNIAAGGWYRLEVRSVIQGAPGPAAVLEKVGVGDIYITFGQSNSANHGAPALTPDDDRVVARMSLDNMLWQHAADPQPIASGSGGSPWSRLGDLLAASENVPIGFLSVGVGSTKVIQWIPGSTYYDERVRPAVESFPANGFRAILWHQGEADSGAGTAFATYRDRLASIIAQTRTDAGWNIPWYVAEVSRLSGSNLLKGMPINAAQRAVIHADENVWFGAGTDDLHLMGMLNDLNHFNAAGLLAHAQLWADILTGNPAPTVDNAGLESNTPLAEGAVHVASVSDTSAASPQVIGWRILDAAGTAASDGTDGYYHPDSSAYSEADHVAFLEGGSAGNHFLQTLRTRVVPDTGYTLSVALGLRKTGTFGNARIEMLANGEAVASATVSASDLVADAFTTVSIPFVSGNSVAVNQPLSIRIVKVDGGDTYLDFDNVSLTAARTPFSLWQETWFGGTTTSTAGIHADPEGDGLSNGLEYFLGSSPEAIDPQPFNGPVVDATSAQVSVALDPSVTDDGLEMDYSFDLETWYAAASASHPGVESSRTASEWTLDVPAELSEHMFFRIKINDSGVLIK